MANNNKCQHFWMTELKQTAHRNCPQSLRDRESFSILTMQFHNKSGKTLCNDLCSYHSSDSSKKVVLYELHSAVCVHLVSARRCTLLIKSHRSPKHNQTRNMAWDPWLTHEPERRNYSRDRHPSSALCCQFPVRDVWI